MRDDSANGFLAACVASGVAFFFTRGLDNGITYFLNYIIGLVVFYAYINSKKQKRNEKWEGEEIFAGFLISALAQWVPAILVFIF